MKIYNRTLTAMKIPCPVYDIARVHPNLIAVKDGNRTLTFGELNNLVQRISAGLKSMNVCSSKRVAIFSRNSIEYVITVLSLMRTGVSFVPLNLRWSDQTIARALRQANCVTVLCDPEIKFEIDTNPIDLTTFVASRSKIGDEKKKESEIQLSLDSEFAVVFTSGSSGEPKGAVLSTGNFYYNALGAHQFIPLENEDCWLASLPFYHVGGLAILFRALVAGASVFIVPDSNHKTILKTLQEQKITHISLVPTMLERLIDSNEISLLKSLRCILLGGAPVPGSLVLKSKKYELPVYSTYGMTETASMVTCGALRFGSSTDGISSGQCLRFGELKILQKNGDQTTPGEICVRGKIVFKGYLESGDSYDSQTWYNTGDLGILDSENNLIIRGRKDDLIISGGENIYPAEIENIVKQFPGVDDCCAIGIDDEQWGQRPVLFVGTGNPARFGVDELTVFLKTQLPKLCLPEKIIVLKKLPRRSIGKVDKELLRKSLTESRGESLA